MASKYHRTSYTAVAVVGLLAGATGIAAASSDGGSNPTRTPAVSVSDEIDEDGVDCENGIDTATGAECDGGPAVAQADEATEAGDSESGASDDGDDDVNCEDGVDSATGDECDGGPSVAQAEEATELSDEGDEAPASGFALPAVVDTADDDGTDETNDVDESEVEEAESDEVGDEADDGVDHQFEGDEVGENGDGVPDADADADSDDATETSRRDD